ncbi:restriction endonuclease subunit S [Pseudoalteromonas sp. 120-MNA-CIBAN-0494]|uniref:restriction endonuclease subunit S n=1 Tax=unclassified Pseudoalteromonas TaxID=194690 RepID=UPI00331EF8BD|tara:strand:+ start:364 stop:2202 length:1839 start_codon:yes stop_codon:yes gene_type:complete
MAESKTPNTNAEQLITEHLDIWTTAIEQKSSSGRGSSKKFSLHGIKKLRELILELAVRGKLVPQDPNDEPASVLLERIAAEKAQLVKDKKIKKPKAQPAISEDEKPFELPKGWAWSRLQDLTSYIQRGKGPKYAESGKVRVISQKCVQNTGFNLDVARYVTDESLSAYQPERYLLNDDILWNSTGTGTVGRANVIGNIVEQTLVADSHVTVIRPLNVYSQFLWCFIMAPGIQSRIEPNHDNALVSGSTKQVELNTSSVVTVVAPVAPLKEQRRIVAKVDELMGLCDALEAQTENSITAHQTLVEVLLEALLKAPEQTATPEQATAQFQQNWQRLSEHFDTLFTTTASIDTLKQTILQLAVMGKLVPQNPNDEPAAKLLERIAAEKAQLIKDKKIKKQKPLPEITDEEKPFELPEGWEWCRFEDIVEINGGITKGRKLAGRELITVPYLSVANVQRSYLNLEHLKEIDIPVEEKEKYRVKKRDLLITEGGDWDKVGRTAIWSDELDYVGHQNHVFKARIFLEEQCEVWLEKYLNGPYARDYFAGSSKQTTNLASINKTQLRGCLIAMPPKGELGDIIVKIDELLTLCDQLKARLTDAQTTKLHLTDAIVEQAL